MFNHSVSLHHITDVATKRMEIKSTFNATFSMYESLFGLLSEDAAFFERPEPLRHPLIFYFGHTAAFFVNKLVCAKVIAECERIDPAIESTVAIGVDEMSWDDLSEKHYRRYQHVRGLPLV